MDPGRNCAMSLEPAKEQVIARLGNRREQSATSARDQLFAMKNHYGTFDRWGRVGPGHQQLR